MANKVIVSETQNIVTPTVTPISVTITETQILVTPVENVVSITLTREPITVLATTTDITVQVVENKIAVSLDEHPRMHDLLSSDHRDTTLDAPNDGDVLMWDAATSRWRAKAMALIRATARINSLRMFV